MAEEKKQYEIAEGVDKGALIQDVERLRREGYKPIGSMSAADGRFYQAVVWDGKPRDSREPGHTILRETGTSDPKPPGRLKNGRS